MNTLIISLICLQLVLPLILIGLNALVTPVSQLGYWARVAGIVVMLLYLRLSGVWLFPPWWTPYALGVMHAAGSIVAWKRLNHRAAIIRLVSGTPDAPSRSHSVALQLRAITDVVLGGLLLVLATALCIPALQGRIVPNDTISLSSPLEPGTYLVTSGGTTSAVNNHLITLGGEERFKAYRGQSYALDLIGINRWGFHAKHAVAPVDPQAYEIYGKRVLAPCSGSISASFDGIPDMPVPKMDRDNMVGNHVILNCRPNPKLNSTITEHNSAEAPGSRQITIVLAHLAPGSIVVNAGDDIQAGDDVGRVGNSGNTASPHLHVHVQSALPAENPFSADPVWFSMNGRFLVRNDRFIVPQ